MGVINRGIGKNFYAIIQQKHKSQYEKTSKADLLDAFCDMYFEYIDDNASFDMIFDELKRRVEICKRNRQK